jgi:hypothetical protein
MKIANIIGSNQFVTTVLLTCGHRRNIENKYFKSIQKLAAITLNKPEIDCEVCWNEENISPQSSKEQVQNVLVINDGATDSTSNIGINAPTLDYATEATSGDTTKIRE